MILALLLLGAYLVGSIPVGVLVARARGVDLFKVGSGNIGATNVNRALGIRWGVMVFILDLLKGVLPTLAGRYLFPGNDSLWLAAGMAATLGHCFSPFLKFKGGKGVACLLGMVIAATPLLAAVCFGVFVLVVLATRYISLGSIIAVPVSIPMAIYLHEPPASLGVFILVSVLAVVLHRKNIKRLLNGTESKFGKKKPAEASLVEETEVEIRDEEGVGALKPPA